MVTGGRVVEVLYDDRYAEAGWILQVLSIRVAMSCTLIIGESCLVALGHTQYAFLQHVGRTAWILIGILMGWWLSGLSGVVWAVALSEIPVLVVLWWGLSRHGVLSFAGELRSVLFVGVGVLLGFALLQVLPT